MGGAEEKNGFVLESADQRSFDHMAVRHGSTCKDIVACRRNQTRMVVMGNEAIGDYEPSWNAYANHTTADDEVILNMRSE